jgi:hypothetical protein
MFCTKCGNQVPVEAKFCNRYGNSFAQASGQRAPGGASFARADYQRYPHPYHELGGWLKFIAYAPLVVMILAAIFVMVTIVSTLLYMQYLGAALVALLIVEATLVVVGGIFFLIFLGKIKNKDPKFLRLFEIMTIVSVVLMAASLFAGFDAETVRVILSALLGFLIWTTYFRKSVRVHTYFGSEEYLRQSIFFKNSHAPMPADTQPQR